MYRLIALSVLTLVLSSGFSSAQAQRCIGGCVATPAGAPTGSGGPVASPGDPFYPSTVLQDDPTEDPIETGSTGNPGSGGAAPVTGGNAPSSQTASRNGAASADECGSDLGGLRRVRAATIRAVGYGDNIDIVPICVGKGLGQTQDNVEGLRAPIGQNETLMAALQREGFGADQVVGVVVNNAMVVLYVH